MSADQLADRLGLTYADDREFATAAGYVLSVLKKLPVEGESFVDQGWRFEVIDMDGRKIDKLLVAKNSACLPENRPRGFGRRTHAPQFRSLPHPASRAKTRAL